jgi:RNA polymerase sigma-70 factor (ECF subfamily)
MEQEQQAELETLLSGGRQALAEIFSRYQPRLERMVRFRLDQRLWGRVDPLDVLQDAFIEVSRGLPTYLKQPGVPVFVWLRSMTEQTVVDVHRRHLKAGIRDAKREVSLHRHGQVSDTSASLAAQLMANLTSPSRAAMRKEMHSELREALDRMDPVDREILALRHFEELTNNEAAAVLGLQKSAASNRYVRALQRLKGILAEMPAVGLSSAAFGLQEPGNAQDHG